MSVEDPKMEKLIERLLRRTREGAVDWESLPIEAFKFKSPTGSIIVRTRDLDGTYPYVLELFDTTDDLIETATTPTRGPRIDDWSDSDVELVDLYDAARRSARDIDVSIEGFLRDIG